MSHALYENGIGTGGTGERMELSEVFIDLSPYPHCRYIGARFFFFSTLDGLVFTERAKSLTTTLFYLHFTRDVHLINAQRRVIIIIMTLYSYTE